MSPSSVEFLLIGITDQKERESIIHSAHALGEGVPGSYPEALSVLLTSCARSVHQSTHFLESKSGTLQKILQEAQKEMGTPREELAATTSC